MSYKEKKLLAIRHSLCHFWFIVFSQHIIKNLGLYFGPLITRNLKVS